MQKLRPGRPKYKLLQYELVKPPQTPKCVNLSVTSLCLLVMHELKSTLKLDIQVEILH